MERKIKKELESTGAVKVLELKHVTYDNCKEAYVFAIVVEGLEIKDIIDVKENDSAKDIAVKIVDNGIRTVFSKLDEEIRKHESEEF